MEMNPQRVRSAEFRTVRRGIDPEEVRTFLAGVADELERAQNQSTAMEARARAAVARLQEVTESSGGSPDASVEESETISRTLLLAQRTADAAVAEAKADAERITAAANDEAARTIDSTREMSAQMLDEARAEARRVGDAARESVQGEVEALKARRDFLESDVDHLESFLVEQRARLRDAASAIVDVTERVPGGLGEVRRPLLSASDDDAEDADEVPEVEALSTRQSTALDPDRYPWEPDVAADDATADDVAADDATGDDDPGGDDAGDDDSGTTTDAVDEWLAATELDEQEAGAEDLVNDLAGGGSIGASAGDPTEALPVVDEDRSDAFRFSFDDDRS